MFRCELLTQNPIHPAEFVTRFQSPRWGVQGRFVLKVGLLGGKRKDVFFLCDVVWIFTPLFCNICVCVSCLLTVVFFLEGLDGIELF